MAEKIQSIFGPYADKMQVVIDKKADAFASTWFQKYFDWGVTSLSLQFTTAIGRSRIEAAASIVDREASAPLRGRNQLEKLSGEVPAIKEKFKLSETDYRNFMTLQAMNVSDATKKAQLLDLMFGDVKKAGEAPLKRLDIMCLQAISTGYVKINADTNPDGIALGDIPLLMPESNFVKVTEKWSVPATATPITDIQTEVKRREDKGISTEKMLMTRNTFWKFQKCTEVVQSLNGFFHLPSNAKVIGTIEQINEYLASNLLPMIEIVNEVKGIEKDGIITAYRPFNDTSVSFLPAGKLGIIHNAYAIEQLKPVSNVNYATYEKVLISKWQQNDPFAEFTGCELSAFPGVEQIDSISIMDIETKA